VCPAPVSEAPLQTPEALSQLSLFQPASDRRQEPVLIAFRRILAAHIPEPAVPAVSGWFVYNRVKLRITSARISKRGDFRPPRKNSIPVISVNGTLNGYAFLITLIHEMAHFQVYDRKRRSGFLRSPQRVAPHGKEWRQQFRDSLEPFLSPQIFPDDILEALKQHLKNPRATSGTDPVLDRALMRYDVPQPGIPLEDLPLGSRFTVPRGWVFRKEEKLRKRYRCLRLNDHRVFLFSPLARVVPVNS